MNKSWCEVCDLNIQGTMECLTFLHEHFQKQLNFCYNVYFVELCTCSIPNVSDCLIPEESTSFLQLTVESLVTATSRKTSDYMSEGQRKMKHEQQQQQD